MQTEPQPRAPQGREIEFLRQLGMGGFGAVYLANLHGRDRFVRRVAVKVMREGLDATPDLVARQKDEARLLGLLAHDGIVQVLDLAEVEGRPAVVMEYVEGVDLSDLQKHVHPRRFPVRAALEVVAATASALDAAFSSTSALTGQPLRVIHRDIKPANLLLTVHGRVKVLDFGVAKADFARDGHTTNGGWGTPRFMTPEQWLGESYGAPVDIYALGVTLFDLVADRPWERPPLNRTPFEAHVARQLDAQVDVPEPVLALVARMTAFEAADRPTAAEVREEAERLLADAPGDSLARFARAEVPPLLELRSRTQAQKPVPGPVTLGGMSPSQARGAADRTFEPSIVPDGNDRRRVALAGAAALVAAGFVVLAGVLAVLAWQLARPDTEPIAEPIAEVTVPAEAPADPPPPPVESPSVATARDTLTQDAAEATGTQAVTPAQPAGGSGTVAPTGSPPPSTKDTPKETPKETPPSAVVETKVTPRQDPKPPPPPDTKPKEPDPTPATVAYSIQSDPIGADVWVDGKRVGKTPLPSWPLTEGEHRLEVVLGQERSGEKIVTVTTGTIGVRYYFQNQTWRSIK